MFNIVHLNQQELLELVPIFVGASTAYIFLNCIWSKLSNLIYKAMTALNFVSLLNKDSDKPNGNKGVESTTPEKPDQKRANKHDLKQKNKPENSTLQPKVNDPIQVIHKQPAVTIILPLNPLQIISNNLLQQLQGFLQFNSLLNLLPNANNLVANPDAPWRNASKNHEFAKQPASLKEKVNNKLAAKEKIMPIIALASNYYMQHCRSAKQHSSAVELNKYRQKLEKSCKDILMSILLNSKLADKNTDSKASKHNYEKDDVISSKLDTIERDYSHEAEQAAKVIKQLIDERRDYDSLCDYGWDKDGVLTRLMANNGDSEYKEAVMQELLSGNYAAEMGISEQQISAVMQEISQVSANCRLTT